MLRRCHRAVESRPPREAVERLRHAKLIPPVKAVEQIDRYRRRLEMRCSADRFPKSSKLSCRTSPLSEQMHSLLISGNETSSLGQPQWQGQPQIVTNSRCPSRPKV